MFPKKVPSLFDLSKNGATDLVMVKRLKNATYSPANTEAIVTGAELRLVKCKRLTFTGLTFDLAGVNVDHFTGARDAVRIEKCRDIKFQNCTFTHSIDELVSVVSSKRIQFIGCTFIDPLWVVKNSLNEWIHPDESSHGYGLLIRGSYDVDVFNCIFDNIEKRAPSVSPDGKFDCKVFVKNCRMINCKEAVKINRGSSRGDIELKVYDSKFIHCTVPIKLEKIRGRRRVKFKRNTTID